MVSFNLISNTIKFTDRGNIYVNVDLVKDNKDSITILFEVKDDGVGIPKEKQGNVFEEEAVPIAQRLNSYVDVFQQVPITIPMIQ